MSFMDTAWGVAFGGGHALGADLRRGVPRLVQDVKAIDRRTVTLDPRGPQKGRVLLAYVIEGFFRADDEPFMGRHTHYWEALEIARAWSELGFRVDAIDNYNLSHRPEGSYDVVVGARMILEPLLKRMDNEPLKVFHIDTCHWLANNTAQLRRIRAVQDRRGETLKPRKLIEVNRAAELADVATVLGNDFTMGTYAFRDLAIHRVPISSVAPGDWMDRDMETARRSFVWLGSQGLVHKGLDLVLEAFAGMPDLDLYVCGPIDEEKDFVAAYRRELHETPNIHPIGWIDVQGPEWAEIARKCSAVVYPSCAEGGGGSVIACMHQGLMPLVTPSASVDVPDGGGLELKDETVEGIREAVRSIAGESPRRLVERSRSAWEHVRRHHTRAAFAENYRAALGRIGQDHGLS